MDLQHSLDGSRAQSGTPSADVIEHVGTRQIGGAQAVDARIRYFDYGVASVELQMPFRASWEELVILANRWIMSPQLESCASDLLKESLNR